MKTMQRVQKGFTLIELMIVVAIIGILAAVALPAYQDYTKRGRVTEGLALAGGAKTAVTEYYASNSAMPSSNTLAGIADATDINGNSVTSVTVGTGGTITVVFKDNVETGSKTLVLKPITSSAGAIKWECGRDSASTVNAKYRPSECRSTGT